MDFHSFQVVKIEKYHFQKPLFIVFSFSRLLVKKMVIFVLISHLNKLCIFNLIAMKKITFITLSLLFFVLISSSCKKTTSTTCNLAKTDKVPSAMTIYFKADKTGDGTLSTLTYKVGTVEKTVSHPALPWSVQVSGSAGDNLSITAIGTTSNGSITISYDGKNATDEIKGSDYCSHSN